MPFTPFHFGPGMLIKSFAGRLFWLTSFVAANVLIDIEVLYYLAKQERPLHRYVHSYLGGTVAGLVAGVGMYVAVRSAVRLLPLRWKTLLTTNPNQSIVLWQSMAAGVVGGISHVFLDSLIHGDMQPFWPLAGGNEFAGLIPSSQLHMALALSGVLGGALWLQAYLTAGE